MAIQKNKGRSSHRKSKRNPKGRKTMAAIIRKNQGFSNSSGAGEEELHSKSLERPLLKSAKKSENAGRRKSNLTRGGKRRTDADRVSMGPARSYQTMNRPYTGAQPNKEDRPKF